MNGRREVASLAYLGVIVLALLLGWFTSTAKGSAEAKSNGYPAEQFVLSLDNKKYACRASYLWRELLPNGLRYGESVRRYSLAGKSAAQVKVDMLRLGCAFKLDVLREPQANQPILYGGQTIPLWVFLCQDGGVVRIKPLGDPANRFRPQPHGSKALRYPYDSKFENFSDEVVKVDDNGNAIPKSRADLAQKHLADGWAKIGHMDLAGW